MIDYVFIAKLYTYIHVCSCQGSEIENNKKRTTTMKKKKKKIVNVYNLCQYCCSWIMVLRASMTDTHICALCNLTALRKKHNNSKKKFPWLDFTICGRTFTSIIQNDYWSTVKSSLWALECRLNDTWNTLGPSTMDYYLPSNKIVFSCFGYMR